MTNRGMNMEKGKENWVKLCKEYGNFLREKNVKKINEQEFHHSFFVPTLKKIFSWKIEGEDNEVPLRVGRETKYADIVLKGNDYKIVIELKAPKEKLDEKDIYQLWGYMGILRIKYGFLIGNKILAIYEDDNGEMKISNYWEYNEDAPDGIDFGGILDASFCSSESLKKYMEKYTDKPKITEEDKKMSEENRKINNFFYQNGYSVRQKERHKKPYFTEKKGKISWVLTPSPNDKKSKEYEFKWETQHQETAIEFDEVYEKKVIEWCEKKNRKEPEKANGGKKNNIEHIRKIFIHIEPESDTLDAILKDTIEILDGTKCIFGWPKLLND
jgi:hypothetical protein